MNKFMRAFGAMILAAGIFFPAGPIQATEDPPPPAPITLTVGHVGHDHQIALYVAADAGEAIEKQSGVYLKTLKDREVYDLMEKGKAVARIQLVKVGGGSGMPASMEQGAIEVGLGGLAPVAKYADRGAAFKVLAPLNNDGDTLVLSPDFPATDWPSFVRSVKESKKPVRIGYKAPMAVAYMILTKALATEGISYGQDPVGKDGKPVQVITVNLQGDENMVPSMEAKLVDGVVANEPAGSLIIQKGLGKKAADLSELPPDGLWLDHPCCVVAATSKALEEKRGAIVSLLKVIAAGTDLIHASPDAALAAEGRWTKTPAEVAKMSIPQVTYLSRPDDRWKKGVDTWLDLMLSMNHFDKAYKGKKPAEVREMLVDLGPLTEALAGMPGAHSPMIEKIDIK